MALKNKQGQSIVEFAIVFPVFILLTFGCLYMGMFMHDYMAIGELTREVARYEAVGTKYDTIKDDLKLDTRLTGMYKINKPEITYPKDSVLGDQVSVRVTMVRNNSQMINLVDNFMPKQISSTLVMRKER